MPELALICPVLWPSFGPETISSGTRPKVFGALTSMPYRQAITGEPQTYAIAASPGSPPTPGWPASCGFSDASSATLKNGPGMSLSPDETNSVFCGYSARNLRSSA